MGIPGKGFKVNGKPTELINLGLVSAIVRKLLDDSPHDELLTNDEVSRRLGRDARVVAQQRQKLPAYHALAAGRSYWGNPKAIAELKRQLAAGQ